MDLDYVLKSLLLDNKLISACEVEKFLPKKLGLYTIFIDDPNNFPEPFVTYLKQRETKLIYLGKAVTQSLYVRLFEQDLRHEKPSTFFRAIGPILGYWPPKGSRIGYAKPNNYDFNSADTQAIIGWINKHLSIRYVTVPSNEVSSLESGAIVSQRPLLNTCHNPEALSELRDLRKKCRKIALTK